ncbi:MAG: argininosuccinate lyase [Marinilabiliaceae bacterium]|nr:argininosuccinate lyase [Marinilabiliaceae bacterium]
MKLWDKGYNVDDKIDKFTVGLDREMDLFLAPYDVMGTMAHITMLESVGLLKKDELTVLLAELKNIYQETLKGNFRIEDDIEDVHSQVELMLTRRLGDIGKKVHSGRSRNDQVLLDLKLYARAEIEDVVVRMRHLFDVLQAKSEQYKNVLIPGYTHLQVAMPSSFGLWFGAYAESLADDMLMMEAAWHITNQNPLGAAAGYGSSFPLNRTMTTQLLGFEDLDYNVVYAQMGRGKTERIIGFALAAVAETVGRLAVDGCMYTSQNFGFIHLPKQMTTGSSIMPHKKNPDVFELIRAHCNKIQGMPNTIRLITGNLPSGYFRDMQITKEVFIPVFNEMKDCLDIASYAIENMEVVDGIMDDPKYKLAFSVEEVNRLANEGVPFRDAYKQVGIAIERGEFEFHGEINHTHEGSIGNLCTDKIKAKMDRVIGQFGFEKVESAIEKLTK